MKRKDFSNLVIDVHHKKNTFFEHENYISGTPPFLRGINSITSINKALEFTNTNFGEADFDYSTYSLELKLATKITKILEFTRTKISEGEKIAAISEKLCLNWELGIDYIGEIAALRSARMLWAKLSQCFNPKNSESLALKINCKTKDLAEKNKTQIFLKSIHTTVAIFSEVQFINGLPIKKYSYNTEQFLFNESEISKTIDPWAGSDLIEKRTQEITSLSWNLIQKIEHLGGFSKALNSDFLKNIQP